MQIEGTIHVRELTLPKDTSGVQPAAPFVLTMGESRLRGTLAPAGSALGWRPVGSRDVIPLASDGRARITRVDMQSGAYTAHLADLVKSGAVPQKAVDDGLIEIAYLPPTRIRSLQLLTVLIDKIKKHRLGGPEGGAG